MRHGVLAQQAASQLRKLLDIVQVWRVAQLLLYLTNRIFGFRAASVWAGCKLYMTHT